MKRIATQRAVLLQAWRAAQKRIEIEGAAQLTHEEEAGRLLSKWETSSIAYAMCDDVEAREHLAKVVNEDGGEVLPSGGVP